MNPVLTFSIITPSYNQGQFLAETIESVLSQQGDFCLDYIVVDGGSTDSSVEIIKRYQELLEKGAWPVQCRGISLRWLSEKDRGQTDALLKGFAMVRGEILAWLNSDDVYLPGALQAATDFFRLHPDTGLMYGQAHYCDPAGAVVGSYRTDEFDYHRLAWFNFICQPSTFFSREAFEAAGGLDRSLHFSMDYDLWLRIGRRFPCRYLPQYLSKYRLHESSKTISDATLLKNIEEGIGVARKYFDWAPLTRVYAWCNCSCRSRLPRSLAQFPLVLVGSALVCTLFRSLKLNRGVRLDDLKLLNRSNFGKLFRSRYQVMVGADRSQPGAKP